MSSKMYTMEPQKLKNLRHKMTGGSIYWKINEADRQLTFLHGPDFDEV